MERLSRNTIIAIDVVAVVFVVVVVVAVVVVVMCICLCRWLTREDRLEDSATA